MQWQDYITVDRAVCHGMPCLRETRIPVTVVLDNLAAGQSFDEILRDYPSLSHEAIRAVLLFASALIRRLHESWQEINLT
jgi:uncharacterized protein (DUF433 family)